MPRPEGWGVKCRNGGRWTQAKYEATIKNALRKISMYWCTGDDYLKTIRRDKTEASGPGKHKYEYPCEHCDKWMKREDVELDHKVPVGSVKDWNGLIERMFCEINGWNSLCHECHVKKTNQEKVDGKY